MRTKYCGEIKKKDINKIITICGWVHKIRSLKNIIFIDIKDITGIIQVIFLKKYNSNFSLVKTIRNDYCIKIKGLVILKKKLTYFNTQEKENFFEIIAFKLKIFNPSLPIPFDYKKENKEDIRFKFRYLDLRRFYMFHKLQTRSKITTIIRNFFIKKKFLEIETPILTRSTPEGAKDYLVYSRLYPGKYFALPQSPQLFKQLLMISGIDRYFQIAKCFRDEDLRSDRQPEFTQIDIEIAFKKKKFLQKLINKLIKKLWLKINNYTIKKIKNITYKESILKYGTDKPDLRNPIQFVELYDIFNNFYKKFFPWLLIKNINRIISIKIPEGIKKIRDNKIYKYKKFLEKLNFNYFIYVKIINIKKYIIKDNRNIFSKIDKKTLKEFFLKTSAINGDIIFIIAEKYNIANNISNLLRKKIGIDLKITNLKKICPVWITKFPLFKLDKKNNLKSVHHPFTSPEKNSKNIELLNPLKIISSAFDLVINGYEIGGGSERIYNYQLQIKIFNILKINKNKQKKKFGFFINSLQYGAPPHLGLALGLDRLVMLLTNCNTISDVIAFPKTNSAICLMTGAPC
ncbi:aspartate--tRNA ligase [Buchnera aphidicola]|uniref:Aspartate--tRNA ligase n=1 Tax=Buchnera aphidicola subsp. Cinara cedri (strain Cc) TaxID=372461 RepID=Q057N1_BUCCC|nr:aspartate--tRNA ligase [Buchnera aphidicola]ABJ90668.1 aspartyl-tRNA synthetase [Buchnera aphidicola BCc]